MSNVKAFITDVNRDGFHEVAEAIRATGGKDAEDINYDNTASGLDADNVQAAIDEVSGDVSDLVTAVNGISGDVNDLETAVSGLSGDVSDLGTAVSGLSGDVSDLGTAVNGKVNKSGDTMTGILDIQRPSGNNAFLKTTNTTNNLVMGIGIDGDGVTRGIYDYGINNWLFNTDGTNVYANNTKIPYNGGTLALKSDIWTLNGHTLPYTGQATFDADTRSAKSIVLAVQITDGNGNWYNFAQGNTGAYGQFSGGSPICYVTDNTFYDKDCRAIMLLVS